MSDYETLSVLSYNERLMLRSPGKTNGCDIDISFSTAVVNISSEK